MKVVDQSCFYIQEKCALSIWNTNLFNTNFTTLSSAIKNLQRRVCADQPSIILVRTMDGVIRLISPLNARTITATLPLLETDVFEDVVYHRTLNRLYLLLQGGTIVVYQTDKNPCVIVDKWESPENRSEDCRHLVLCYGQFNNQDQEKMHHSLSHFSLLLGGTTNGHVLIYGKNGSIVDRYQLHFSEFTKMIYDETSQTLITAGLDERIHISAVAPLEHNIIQILIVIQCGFIPRHIANEGHVICASSDDTSINMFSYNLAKKNWRKIMGHGKALDHSEAVKSVCYVTGARVFVSIGCDCAVKVWNLKNQLVRDIQFQEQLSDICVRNDKGDLLVAVNNRLDIIGFSTYAGNSARAPASTSQDLTSEIPINFEDDLIPYARNHHFMQAKEHLGFDRDNRLEVFNAINLLPGQYRLLDYKQKSKDSNRLPALVSKERTERIYEELMSQAESARNNIPKVPRIQSRVHAARISKAHNQSQNAIRESLDSNVNCFAALEPSITEILNNQETPAEIEPTKVLGKYHKALVAARKFKLTIAPDGKVPNSYIINDVKKWRHEHGIIDTEEINIIVRDNLARDEEAEARKRQQEAEYKAKVKLAMENMMKPPELEFIAEPVLEERLLPADNSNAEEPTERQVIYLAASIERLMHYYWFNEDDLFFPDPDLPIPASYPQYFNSRGETSLKPVNFVNKET